MNQTLFLFSRLLPLYGFVLLGFLAARFWSVKKESLAPMLIYLLTPILFFQGVMDTPLSGGRIFLPLLIFAMSAFFALTVYRFGGLFFKKPALNILAFSAGNANSGYFGFPLAFLLYGQEGLGLAVLLALGFVVYENWLGFYLTARGHYSAKDSLIRLARLPSLYAFALAFLLKSFGAPSLPLIADMANPTRCAVLILFWA